MECDRANPLVALLFALTRQPVLERIDAACEVAPLVSYQDDINNVGKLMRAAGSIRQPYVDDDGVRSIRLEPRLPKFGICGDDEELVAAETAKLRITHQLSGFTSVSAPLGSTEYVSTAMGRRAATVDMLLETLVQLPLSVQSRSLRCVPHCKHGWRIPCGRYLATRWRRTCIARMLQCVAGGGSRAQLAPGGG